MKRVILLLVAGMAGLALADRAQGQALDLSGGGPVDVTARGGFEWRENEQIVIATGDARAVRDNVTVLADRLVARYRKKAPDANAAKPVTASGSTAGAGGLPGGDDNGGNEVYRLEAHGNVRIVTETDEAVGDDAVYDIDQAVLVMTGKNLKLTTPQQVLTARDTLEYWSQKHMAVGRGNAVVVTADGRRLAGDVLVAFTHDDAAPGAPKAPTPTPTPAPVVAAVRKPGADPLGSSGKLERVEAYGNVEVRTAVDIVRGDRGLYLPDTGIARVVGRVKITHNSTQINGPAADINMKTGIARINAAPGGRVSGVIVPNDPLDAARAKATPPKPKAP
jgi:lipopolysaccharide export system protein LptA